MTSSLSLSVALDQGYKIRGAILADLTKIRNRFTVIKDQTQEQRAVQNYVELASQVEIYLRKNLLGDYDPLLRDKLASHLFDLSRLLYKFTLNHECDHYAQGKDSNCSNGLLPWFTFVILYPTTSLSDKDSPDLPPRYIFHSFGIADAENPNDWYNFLERQKTGKVDETFTITSLLYERLDLQTINTGHIFRIRYYPSSLPDSKDLSPSSSEYYTDISILNPSEEKDPIKIVTTNKSLEKKLKKWLRSVNTSKKDGIYTGLKEYINQINQFMDSSGPWILYGFPFLSINTNHPHSGLYMYAPSKGVCGTLLHGISFLASSVLWPIDQLHWYYRTALELKLAQRLGKAAPILTELRESLGSLRKITGAVERLSVVLDKTYWNPGLAEFQDLGRILDSELFARRKHNVSDFKKKDLDLFCDFLQKAHVSSARELFYLQLRESNLLDTKIVDKLFKPWSVTEINRNKEAAEDFFESICLAKSISKGRVPGYWIKLVLNAESVQGNLQDLDHAVSVQLDGGAKVVEFLIALSRLQKIGQLRASQEDGVIELKIDIRDDNRSKDGLKKLEKILTTIFNDKGPKEGGGETTRTFNVLYTAGMRFTPPQLNGSLLKLQANLAVFDLRKEANR